MKIVLLLLFFFSFVSIVQADCIRCKTDSGSELACTGASKYEIISKCGRPDYSETVTEEKTSSISGGSINVKTEVVELLYYNCGEGQNIRILKIRGGELISIRDGDRSSGPTKCW